MKNESKKILIFLDNGFRYEGDFIEEDETFLTILDYKTGHKISLKKNNIKVREEGKKNE
jgi:sRNA-binding regulator protein Hfq